MKILIALGALASIGQFILLAITVWRSHYRNVPMTVTWETNPSKEDMKN